jgi:hypothetical protein
MNYDKMFRLKYHHNLVWDTSKVEKGCNNDDDNDTDILDEAIEAPNDSDYHGKQTECCVHRCVRLG